MANVALEADQGALLHGFSENAVRAALRESNPKAPVSDLRTMAKIMKLVFDVVVELPSAKRREIAQGKDRVRQALFDVATPSSPEAGARVHIEDAGRTEHSRGTGLGERICLEEGQSRLARYATPRPLESWAGPVAGAGEIAEQFGIPRSTLSNWQKRGAVIGLLRGERKLAYPLEQFVDARPLQGVGDVLRIAPDARAAWLWLRQVHGALDGKSPLDCLRAGERPRVVTTAERDFQ